MIELSDIKSAYRRLARIANRTPVMTSRSLDRDLDCSVFLKCENFQRAGSFKFRGAYNTLIQLPSSDRQKGVITHSSGNHGQALAMASKMLGIKCTVVMPATSSPVKIESVKGYGAKVVMCGPTPKDRADTTSRLIVREGYKLVHPYDNDNIIAGAGTAMFEFVQQARPLDFVFCPIGGGGLISGTSIAAKGLLPNIRVIGAEPSAADDAYLSFAAGTIIENKSANTIADGLRTNICERTFAIIRKNVNRIVTVREEDIVESMRFLWERMKLVVEPSGCVPLAALMSKKTRDSEEISGKRVGVILSGGNVNLEPYFRQWPTTKKS